MHSLILYLSNACKQCAGFLIVSRRIKDISQCVSSLKDFTFSKMSSPCRSENVSHSFSLPRTPSWNPTWGTPSRPSQGRPACRCSWQAPSPGVHQMSYFFYFFCFTGLSSSRSSFIAIGLRFLDSR